MSGSLPALLLADDLDQHPLPPPPVEFTVEDTLPRAKDFGELGEAVQPAVGHRHNNLAAHNLALHMSVGNLSVRLGQASSPVSLCRYCLMGA